jgi:hypothetical protein
MYISTVNKQGPPRWYVIIIFESKSLRPESMVWAGAIPSWDAVARRRSPQIRHQLSMIPHNRYWKEETIVLEHAWRGWYAPPGHFLHFC